MTADPQTGGEPRGTEGASPLELSYRRLLRVLPRAHRDRWADDMVSVLLDAEQDAAAATVAREGAARQAEERELALLRRPPLREVVAVLALAVRLHLAAPATPGASEAGRRRGAAVRRVALLGLLVPAAHGVVDLAWVPVQVAGAGYGPLGAGEVAAYALSELLTVLVWVLLVLGRARAALLLAVGLAVVSAWPALWEWVWAVLLRHQLPPLGGPLVGLVTALPVLALLAWHDDAGRPDRRWWWTLPGAAVLVAGLAALEVSGAAGAGWAVGVVVPVAALAVGLRRRDGGWLLTAVVLAALHGLTAGAALLSYAPAGNAGAFTVVLAVTAAVSVALVGAAAGALRRCSRGGPTDVPKPAEGP